MTTRGIQFLKRNHIAHEVLKYDHATEGGGAEPAAQALGFPLEQTIKTLVAVLDNQRYILVLMPGDRQLSMKKLARVCRAKRADMAESGAAERLTGYRIGGISLFGNMKRLEAVMDATLMSHQNVIINAGQRGVMVNTAPGDIEKALTATISDLSN